MTLVEKLKKFKPCSSDTAIYNIYGSNVYVLGIVHDDKIIDIDFTVGMRVSDAIKFAYDYIPYYQRKTRTVKSADYPVVLFEVVLSPQYAGNTWQMLLHSVGNVKLDVTLKATNNGTSKFFMYTYAEKEFGITKKVVKLIEDEGFTLIPPYRGMTAFENLVK